MARSARSDSTASDASVVNGKEPSRYRDDNDEDDDAVALAAWDDEERVELIHPSYRPKKQPTKQQRTAKVGIMYADIIQGILLVLSVPALFLLFFVAVWWLSTPTHTSHSAAVVSAANLIDEPATQPHSSTQRPNIDSLQKYRASSNDEPGAYGLLHASSFSLSEQVSGWSTPRQADKVLGLPTGTTQKTLQRQGYRSLRPVTMDVLFNGTFAARHKSLRWIAEDKNEGVFAKVDPYSLDVIFEDVTHARKEQTGLGSVAQGGGKVTYIHGADLKDENGNQIVYSDFHPSPDLSHALFIANILPVWRYSTRFNVWIHDLQTKHTVPVGGVPKGSPNISNVAWIPNTSKGLVYVQGNDLFVDFDPMRTSPIRITIDGSDTVFNGGADWVYEEEVFLTNPAIYLSPGGTKLVWLRFDETHVPVYEFSVYNPSPQPGSTTPYLSTKRMKYPKPGFENPVVSAHMIDLRELQRTQKPTIIDLISPSASSPRKDTEASRVDAYLSTHQGQKQRIVNDVKWLDDDHLLLVETNRVADKLRTLVFETSAPGEVHALVGEAVRHRDVGNKSWITPSQSITPLRRNSSTAYVELLTDHHGFKHIAYFPDARASVPAFLTTGESEVEALLFIDNKRERVYFSAASPAHYRRHVFYVRLPSPGEKVQATSTPTDLVGQNLSLRSYEAEFDPKGAYYVLKETGPLVPTSKVVGVDETKFEWTLEQNVEASNISAQFVRSQHVYYNVSVADSESGEALTTTVQEIRPHDFDPNIQYPVLLHVYGGPNSQQVKHTYNREHWHEYLANHLGYVIAVVDGRGTGFKGSRYSNAVTRHLGRYEVQDLLATAEKLRSLSYVDENRIGLWGWSYGGYFTLKALQADSGILSLGMAVAPVAKWDFYDSIYTERYMKSPAADDNRVGYDNSSVHISDGFRNARLLLAHGTGDDNVHFESSAHILDMLTAEGVRGFWFRAFPDSTHAMRVRNAYRELHEWMTEFLMTQWGAGGKRQFRPPTKESTVFKKLIDKYSRRADLDCPAEQQERIAGQQKDIVSFLMQHRRTSHAVAA